MLTEFKYGVAYDFAPLQKEAFLNEFPGRRDDNDKFIEKVAMPFTIVTRSVGAVQSIKDAAGQVWTASQLFEKYPRDVILLHEEAKYFVPAEGRAPVQMVEGESDTPVKPGGVQINTRVAKKTITTPVMDISGVITPDNYKAVIEAIEGYFN